MPHPADFDLQAFAGLLRTDKMIADAEVMLGPDTAITAVITPHGFRTGAVLRHRVMRLAGNAGPGVQVVVMGKIPRNPDGSLDATEVLSRIGEAYRFEPPTTATEVAIVEVVGKVLHGVAISMTDSIGELGGDSLTTIEIVTLIAERFGIEIPAHQAFGAASIRQLAAMVEAETHDG